MSCLTHGPFLAASCGGKRLSVTRRKLRFEGFELPPEKYEELKNFFSVVQKGDEGHAVLRPDGEEKAQSRN